MADEFDLSNFDVSQPDYGDILSNFDAGSFDLGSLDTSALDALNAGDFSGMDLSQQDLGDILSSINLDDISSSLDQDRLLAALDSGDFSGMDLSQPDIQSILYGNDTDAAYKAAMEAGVPHTFMTDEGFVTYDPSGLVSTGTEEGRRTFYTNEGGKPGFVDYENINDPNAMVYTTQGGNDRNYYFNGNYVGYDDKGNVTTAGPSGSGAVKTIYTNDGGLKEIMKDGSVKITNPDGKVTVTPPPGTKPGGGGGGAKPDQQKSSLNALLPLLLMLLAMNKDKGGGASSAVIPALTATQKQTPYTAIQQAPGYRPGQGGITYFNPVQYAPRMAAGGIADLSRGRLLEGPGDGVSDSIPATIDGMAGGGQPARLARGEYVIDARTVAALGNGSTDAGAERLDEMRRKILADDRKAGVGKDSKAYRHLKA